jgi:hypothetical protein
MVREMRKAGGLGVTGAQFDDVNFPGGRIMRYAARIYDLKQRGYIIEKGTDPTSGTARYILRGEPAAPVKARPPAPGVVVTTAALKRAQADRVLEDVPSEGLFALDNYKRKPQRPE